MSSVQFNITDAVQRSVQSGMQRGMEQAANGLVHEVTQKLAEKFDFDVEQAIELLGVMALETKKKKEPKDSKTKRPSTKKPKAMEVQLPWCGQVLTGCCQAIKSCDKLYVQCMNAKHEDGDYCKRCQTTATKNNDEMPYGVIQDRLKDGYTDKDGKKPVNYGNYMKTKGIKREDAVAQATKLGWTIPEEQFTVVQVKKGRKPKSKKDNVEASDTEDEKEDLFKAAAKAAAEASSSDDDSSDDDEVLVEAPKKRKANRNKAALKVTEESDPKGARTEEEENSELEEEKMNESDEEEVEADVEPFEHDGKDYLIDAEDMVYDVNTHNPVGVYDREHDKLTIL
tara:strand:- start:121 stop:1140 length:1020 start_codon:yes stop_codon:yes gene_type:complete